MKSWKIVITGLLILMVFASACTPAATPAPAAPVEPATVATPVEPAAPAASPAVPVETAAPATSPAVEDPSLASEYSKAILKDAATDVDTSKFKKEGPYTIAVSQQDASNGWGGTYNVSILTYGKELKEKGILKTDLLVSAGNDANQQISDIENFISLKPDAMVIDPLSRSGSTAVIKKAIDEGIPVVLCANGIEGNDFTTRVDVNFYEIGYKSGDGLAKLMGGKGNLVILNGIAGVDFTETNEKAALDAFKKYPDIKIVATEYAQWNVATAKQKMEAIMAGNPQIDGIWAGGGSMALGAALAYVDAKKDAPPFGMVDVPNGFLRMADQYKYKYIGAPDPPSMSKFCLQTAVDILQGKPIKRFIPLNTLMKGGVDPYGPEEGSKWYVKELNDDFNGPMSVSLQAYIDGGFARK